MEENKIQLTIVIPAYKAADTIGRTLESLEIQTDPNFKVIVVQDGPDDELYLAIKKHAQKLNLQHITLNENGGCGHARNVGLDACIVQDGPDDELYLAIKKNAQKLNLQHITLNENGGCGHARNVGLDACKTDYIAYLDADDLYMPYAVDQINQAISSHFDWYAGKFIQRTKGGYIIRGNEHNTWCHGRVYNVGFLKYHGIRFPGRPLRIVDDTPMNILCREFGVEVRSGDLPISMYMPNEKSATRQNDAILRQAYEYIEGNMHYVRIAMRQRQAKDLNQLPQVIVMSYFYLDYARNKGWDCVEKMEKDFRELIKYVDLPKLLEDERYLGWIKQALLIPSRPYPDTAEPPHETFWDMLERLK